MSAALARNEALAASERAAATMPEHSRMERACHKAAAMAYETALAVICAEDHQAAPGLDDMEARP